MGPLSWLCSLPQPAISVLSEGRLQKATCSPWVQQHLRQWVSVLPAWQENRRSFLKPNAQAPSNYIEFIGMEYRYWYFFKASYDFKIHLKLGTTELKESRMSHPEPRGLFVGSRWCSTMKSRAVYHCRKWLQYWWFIWVEQCLVCCTNPGWGLQERHKGERGKDP